MGAIMLAIFDKDEESILAVFKKPTKSHKDLYWLSLVSFLIAIGFAPERINFSFCFYDCDLRIK